MICLTSQTDVGYAVQIDYSGDFMKKMIAIFSFFFMLAASAETGVLFIAHGTMGHHKSNMCGSDNPSGWERYVLNTLNSAKNEIPKEFETAFGMWNSRCFDKAIGRLEQKLAKTNKSLDHLIVFPLFISSHSAVIEMQKFIFKKRADRVIPLPQVQPTSFEGKITYMSAFDYEPNVSMILANRFHHLIHEAKDQGYAKNEMELVLIMHGPVSDTDNAKWMEMGQKYNQDVMYLFPVADSHVISLRDDASDDVRDRATAQLRSVVDKASKNGRIALALPLLISKGGIEAGILERLKGLDYIWSGETLFPDAKLKDAILNKLQTTLK